MKTKTTETKTTETKTTETKTTETLLPRPRIVNCSRISDVDAKPKFLIRAVKWNGCRVQMTYSMAFAQDIHFIKASFLKSLREPRKRL